MVHLCASAPLQGFALHLARVVSTLPARFSACYTRNGIFGLFFFPPRPFSSSRDRGGGNQHFREKVCRSLLARYVSGHLVPAPDCLGSGSQGHRDRCLDLRRQCCPGWYFLPPPQRVRDVNPKLAYQDDWEEARSGGRKVRKERTAVFGPDPKSSLTV